MVVVVVVVVEVLIVIVILVIIIVAAIKQERGSYGNNKTWRTSRWCIRWKCGENGTNSMEIGGSEKGQLEQQFSQSADHMEIIGLGGHQGGA